MPVPRVAHFVFGLRVQHEPFHLLHYLAIESCRRMLAPEAIHLHYRYLPYGVYWDLARPHLTLHRVELVPEVSEISSDERHVPQQYRYAHHADFVRLDVLIETGGVYADIDTLFLRPFPSELFEHPFVLGHEAPVRDENTGIVRPSICNALLMAEPGSEFAVAWRSQMAAALDGTWSNHSGFLGEELTRRLPHTVHVEPTSTFFPFGSDPAGIAALLEGDADPGPALSMHLWSHLWWEEARRDFSNVHAGVLTEQHLRTSETSLARLARPFLPDADLELAGA